MYLENLMKIFNKNVKIFNKKRLKSINFMNLLNKNIKFEKMTIFQIKKNILIFISI